MQDVMYDQYLVDQHDMYIAALEKFASSKNIHEFKKNIEELKAAASGWSSDDFNTESAEKVINDIATLEIILEEFEKGRRMSTKQFWLGLIVGVALTLIGVIL